MPYITPPLLTTCRFSDLSFALFSKLLDVNPKTVSKDPANPLE